MLVFVARFLYRLIIVNRINWKLDLAGPEPGPQWGHKYAQIYNTQDFIPGNKSLLLVTQVELYFYTSFIRIIWFYLFEKILSLDTKLLGYFSTAVKLMISSAHMNN